MSQAATPLPPHPLVRAVEEVSAAVDRVPDSDPIYLKVAEKEQVLTTLAREMVRLEALQLRVLAAADDVADRHAARSAGAWLAHATRQDGSAGRRAQRLADGLENRWPILALVNALWTRRRRRSARRAEPPAGPPESGSRTARTRRKYR